ncbi:MAG: hypothetical protein K6A44_02210 [bacterium]|nr:hypothetical protein [bacterium]
MAVGKISENEAVKPQQTQINTDVVASQEEPQSVSVFTIDDKSMVGRNIQNEADKRLLSIANHVIDKSNKNIATTKKIGIFGIGAALFGAFAKNLLFKGPKPSNVLVIGIIALAALTIAGLVEFFGGNTKRKAGYTKYASSVKDKSNMDLSLAPELKSDFIEKAGKIAISADNPAPLSKDDISKYAPDVLGKDNVRTRELYFVTSKSDNQKAENLLIADATINSEEYDGLSEEGIQKETYEIPVEYTQFVKEYLNNGKLTAKQADRFVEIVKAMQTDGVFSKEQNTKANDGRKEDLDIFDLSGDGNLNYGDISAIKYQAAIQNGVISQEHQALLNDKNQWDTNKLSKLIGLTQDNCFELFDLNGDGNIDETDYNLYQNINKNSDKYDINADGKIDENDVVLTIGYFKAIMDRYNNKGEFLENTISIMGGKDRMDILKEYYEDKEREKKLALVS